MERSKIVLQAMADEGYITEAKRRAAVASVPKIEHKAVTGDNERYFADWVYDQLDPLISDTQQDMIVKTTLDLSLERLADRHVEGILAAHGAEKNVSQAALITLSPDGAVRALTGGRNYRESQFNRATQALRQPGSAFKPIVYLAAIEQGLTPDDVIIDEPVRIGKYAPQNYDGKYAGPVTVRRALAESINTVAVRVLDLAGVGKVIETAKDLGITSPLERNAALALGASEVTPMELATVYASLAAGGRGITPYAIKEIKTREGLVLFRYEEVTPPRVVGAESVATLTEMLRGVIKYGTGRSAALGSRPMAGKTGTTSDYRDAWFAGYTADYTTVVWMGNDDNTPMKTVTGSSLPAQLWRGYMADAEDGLPEEELKNGGIVEQIIDDAGAVSNDVSNALGDFINNILGGKR
jgi:penicillin-binding protein 1A